ncbi:MAG: YwiC-like family protein [Bellilinea sp.]
MSVQANTGLKSVLFQRHIAVPIEHGSWVFLLGPMMVGVVVSGVLNSAQGWVILAALAGFFFRQPLTIWVKVMSRRRPSKERLPAFFWMAVYGLIGLIGVAGMLSQGLGYLVVLALPALPVLLWHLWLVSRREERRKPIVEIAGSGVLGLSAPAVYWAGIGEVNWIGWALWLLLWLQAIGSIVYAYLRLNQRDWKNMPAMADKVRAAFVPLLVCFGSFVLVGLLSYEGVLPSLLPLAYLIQFAEAVWGALNPAIGVKPVAIGVRQLIFSALFMVAFALLWIHPTFGL